MSSGDDALLAELGAAVRAGSEVPDTFVAAGKSAYTWRTVDEELAQLVADSAEEPEGAGLRAQGVQGRWLTFEADGLSVELEVRDDALHGQLVPPQPGSVRLQTGDDASAPDPALPTDEVGYFVARDVPPGDHRLHVRTDAGVAVVTDWFTT